MKDEDVKIGMKVIPHDKTATGWGELSSSNHWKVAQETGQPFLFVLRATTNSYDKTTVWVLGETQGGHGDLFNASDFEPYVKPRRKELQAEIDRLKAEIDEAWKLISAKNEDIVAKDAEAWKLISAKNEDIVAKDAEIAELHQRISEETPKQQVTDKTRDVLPIGTRVIVNNVFGDGFKGTIVDASAPPDQYLVRFDVVGLNGWAMRSRLTVIPADPPDLLPVGTRVMLTGTIIGVDEKDDEFPYGVVIDGDVDAWYPKQSVKPINHD